MRAVIFDLDGVLISGSSGCSSKRTIPSPREDLMSELDTFLLVGPDHAG